MIQNFEQLLEAAARIPGKKVAVILPNNLETIAAVVAAQESGLAQFILIGEEQTIHGKFEEAGKSTDGLEIILQPHTQNALRVAIELVKEGQADILMKGGVDTSTMMKALLAEDSGIRTGRLLSDVFIFEYPGRVENKLIMITDGGLTLAPDLKNKIELINNAVEVAHALGNLKPNVAILSATEMVSASLPSTIDAAALSKMNERGQIKGCVVDGPLALDNAISTEAANEKRINSPVAGKAEILIAPSIEAANMLAKSTTIFAGYRLAHVIVGGKVPVLIPSRADKSDAKLLSVALGVLMSQYYQGGSN
jgi:phosphate butyryltransferase